MGHEKRKTEDGREVQPFIHNVKLLGPQGEVVRVWGTFNDGAMVAAMCSRVFARVRHCLGKCEASTRRLRMADGKIVRVEAVWTGMIQIGNIGIHGLFEVFDSRGSWSFLFGKPLMKAFDAVHYYARDVVTIACGGHAATLCNQIRATMGQGRVMDDTVYQLTNVRPQEMNVGGQLTAMVQPPIRQVPTNMHVDHIGQVDKPIIDTAPEPQATASNLGSATRVVEEVYRFLPQRAWIEEVLDVDMPRFERTHESGREARQSLGGADTMVERLW